MLDHSHIIVTKMKKIIISILVLGVYFLSAPIQAQTFEDYPCTVDCSGHEAGYEWAEENDIQDEDDCGGNSNSFVEGCYSYVEEIEEEQEW